MPFHFAEIIRSFSLQRSCCVGEGGIPFEVKPGVRQGCVMFTVLFNLVVDWIMLSTPEDTEEKVRGIRRTPFSYLEELDYADDLGLALLLHTDSQIQETTQ